MPALVEQHVGRLHVPVHERPPVGGVERAGDLGQHRQRPLGRERPLPPQHAAQIAALHEAHRQVGYPSCSPAS